MLNFSGNTRRRVVNLSDRKQPLNNRNFLEKSRLQRLEREDQKLREKSVLILQRNILKYLIIKRFCDTICDEFLNQIDFETGEYNRWLTKFKYLCLMYLPRLRTEPSKVIEILNAFIHNYKPKSKMDSFVLINLFVLFEDNVEVFKLLIDCFQVIGSYSYKNHQHNSILCKSMIRYYKLSSDPHAITLIYSIGKHDNSESTFHQFIRILDLNVYHFTNMEFLNVLRNVFKSNLGALASFDESNLINMLSNFLVIHGGDLFNELDYSIIAEFVKYLNSKFKLVNEMEEEHQKNVILISDSTFENLQILRDSKFIQGCINLLINEDLDQRKIALQILSKLIYIFPSLKSKVCMLISITPDTYSWFFQTIKQDHIFQEFISTDQDYVNHDLIIDSFFSSVLYLFQESYSYWLIVSNDLESFANDKLSTEKVIEFLEFSKRLCLTLIFNKNENTSLKNISITLLNQLYLKNLRLKFLQQDFWTLKNLKFNIDPLIRILAEEDDNDDDSEEEEEGSRNVNNKNTTDNISKVEVLKKLPFFIDFKDRVRIFQALIELNKDKASDESNFFFMDEYQNKLPGKIRRFNLLQDAYDAFSKTGSSFKNKLQVEFYNEYGPEVGIDGGGITKEFLTSVVNEGFKPGELFKETSENQLYPSELIFEKLYFQLDTHKQHENLNYLRFLGMVVGKCLYENVLINISFAPFFLNKWGNENMKNSINDMNYLDSDLFKNLMKLTRMSNDEIEQLELTFSINQKIGSKIYNFELIPNGNSQQVTSMNILNYIHQLSNFKLNQCLRIQSNYFLQGLFTIISKNWLKMFDANELQMLISGNEENNVNLIDWQSNVEYGGYLENDLTVKYFWQCVAEMNMEEKFKLIKFVTSVNRAPLLGFGAMNPKFGIRNSGRDASRLPTASTCVNLLKLPDYQNKQTLKEKLLYAINTEAGFDLS